jgi:hypothetical protein
VPSGQVCALGQSLIAQSPSSGHASVQLAEPEHETSQLPSQVKAQ